MARGKTPGNRSKGGRKKKASTVALREDAKRVLPTPETVAYIDRRLDYWTTDKWNRASAEQCYDNAGILWITGWFNGHGFQPDEIRDIFRTYASLYWRWYAASAPKIAKGERVGHSEPGIHKEKWEGLFMALDGRLRVGSPERNAVHQLAVNGWHFDEYDPRAMALANLKRVKLRMPVAGEVAGETGRAKDWLDDAMRGAFCMLDGHLAKAMKRQWDIPLWALGNEAA